MVDKKQGEVSPGLPKAQGEGAAHWLVKSAVSFVSSFFLLVALGVTVKLFWLAFLYGWQLVD